MKIKYCAPPNYLDIVKVLPNARNYGVLFCYGDTIYNPSKVPIPQEIIDHEFVHSVRQEEIGIEEWWRRYLTDVDFRYYEELLAHQQEYKTMIQTGNRKLRKSALQKISKKLSSPLYGCCDLNKARKDLIGE